MNKVMLMGRLTKAPEMRFTSTNNKAVTKFTLAVDRRGKKGADKETDFLPCIAWDKLAEFVQNYIGKGQKVVVVGRVQTRNWDDDKGVKHYATEIIAEEVYFADSKKSDTAPSGETNFTPPVDGGDDELPF